MKRGMITGLIYLMAFVTIGLIILQYVFLRTSYMEKNQLVEQNIYTALNQTVKRLENRQSVQFLYKQLQSGKAVSDTVLPVDPYNWMLGPNDFAFSGQAGMEVFLNEAQRIMHDALGATDKGNIRSLNDDYHPERVENFFYYMFKKQNENIQKILEQLERDFRLKQKPLSQRYTNKAIRSLLENEFLRKGLNLDMEYAVVKDNNIHPELKSKNFSEIEKDLAYKINLNPSSLFESTEYLYVYLPGQRKYLMNAISMQLTVSVILILIVLITFFITSYIILRQKRLSEMKNDFISNMTHEFKTPIATIRLAAESLQNPKMRENKAMSEQFSNVITEETRRLNGQVEKILELSLLEKSNLKLNLNTHNIHDILNEAVKNMQLTLRQHKGDIQLLLEAENPECPVDSEHMNNVFCNLIDNAIKYTEKEPHIKIQTKDLKKAIKLIIEDNGIGMDSQTAGRIFDRFYRAGSGNIHNVKGFGLGLHYVKEIIGAHQGDVKVESTPGKGSSFIITLNKTIDHEK